MARKTEPYVDTSALIAFADRSDSYHPLFRRLFAEPPDLVTSTLVVAEGHGWFLRRYDRLRALQFLALMRNRFTSVWDAIEESASEAATLRLRAEIANELIEHLRRRRLTQARAAALLGISEPRVSDLTRGRLDRFSLDALVSLAERARPPGKASV